MLNTNLEYWFITLNAAAPIIYLCLSLIIFARMTYSLETTAREFPAASLKAIPTLGNADEDPKHTYLIRLKAASKSSTRQEREEMIRLNQERLDSFKTELSAWAKENILPGEQPPLHIIAEIPALNMLVVQCSTETKEKLEKLGAIADITINNGNVRPI
ncbi:MAG: hypothetical protein HY986_13500 [Candidatus Melainabacteria bacterium]|nr:hypothetical protein [Candidatus Melainabacteria bacterium]